MSILIQGMEMPQKGLVEIIIGPDGTCYELGRPLIDTEHAKVTEHHKATSIHDHGDLVDAQILHKDFVEAIEKHKKKTEESRANAENYYCGVTTGLVKALKILNSWERPIVIPAERSEE